MVLSRPFHMGGESIQVHLPYLEKNGTIFFQIWKKMVPFFSKFGKKWCHFEKKKYHFFPNMEKMLPFFPNIEKNVNIIFQNMKIMLPFFSRTKSQYIFENLE